jgi:N-acetylneuraminate lyase
MNGVAIPVEPFFKEAIRSIPSFAGIKFSQEDMDEFAECVRLAGDRYDVLMGRDELLLDALERGAHGAVGSTYNYAAPLYAQIMNEHASGARAAARTLQKKAAEMIAICSGFGVTHIAASKTLMKTLGVDCGQVRLPLDALGAEQERELQASLESVGFADFACLPCTTALS